MNSNFPSANYFRSDFVNEGRSSSSISRESSDDDDKDVSDDDVYEFPAVGLDSFREFDEVGERTLYAKDSFSQRGSGSDW